jgi:hypothetical protein
MWFDVPTPYVFPVDPHGSSTVGDEMEAFVHGRLHGLVTTASRRRRPVLELNRVAHGTLAELHDLAEEPRRHTRRRRGRDALGRLLAAQVLARVDHPADLARLQRRALWPLEAMLLASSSELASDASIVAFLASTAIEGFDDAQIPGEA